MVSNKILFLLFSLIFLVFSCTATQPKIPIDMASAQPGEQVNFRGKSIKLLGSPISVGKPLPSVELVDAMTMKEENLSKERGSVLLLSIVPSLDTPVCEEQTHYLGEKGNILPASVKRITISQVRIPTQIGHPFRSKPATYSDPIRPGIPKQTGHPLTEVSDAG